MQMPLWQTLTRQKPSREEKVFFFEKKEAKNFYVFRYWLQKSPRQRSKVFCFFFSKKKTFLSIQPWFRYNE